ncbi:MAG: type IV toxin-antitoxin system AbiEi family antitoxin domain-containing protein [Propionibacteriaceae bacterium]
MRPRQPFPDHLRQLALRQRGVLIRAQLVEAGFVDGQLHRLIEQGLLLRLDVGVYQLGQTLPGWTQWAWAGVLVGGRGSRLMRRP